MKNYKNQAWTFGIIAGVLLIVGGVITWKWMQLRKNVAKVATKTLSPSNSAIIASVEAINNQASEVI